MVDYNEVAVWVIAVLAALTLSYIQEVLDALKEAWKKFSLMSSLLRWLWVPLLLAMFVRIMSLSGVPFPQFFNVTTEVALPAPEPNWVFWVNKTQAYSDSLVGMVQAATYDFWTWLVQKLLFVVTVINCLLNYGSSRKVERLLLEGVVGQASRLGSEYFPAAMPKSQVIIRATTQDGESSMGCGVVVKHSGKIWLVTAKHVVEGRVLVQYGRDGFWNDLPLSYNVIARDGVAWELDAEQVARMGVRQATAMNVTAHAAATVTGDSGLASSGMVSRIDRYTLRYTGSTEQGFSGAPVMVGTKVAGIHMGVVKDMNVSFCLATALEGGSGVELEAKSGRTSDMQDTVQTYYNRAKAPVKPVGASWYQADDDKVAPGGFKATGQWADSVIDWESRAAALQRTLDLVSEAKTASYERRISELEARLAAANVTSPIVQPPQAPVPVVVATQSRQVGVDFRQRQANLPSTPPPKKSRSAGSESVNISLLEKTALNPSTVSRLSLAHLRKLRKQLKNQDLVTLIKPSKSMESRILGRLQRLEASQSKKSTSEQPPPPPQKSNEKPC